MADTKDGCKGGRRYPDVDTAYAAALRVSVHIGPVRVYKCPGCHGFHLTRHREWKERP